MILLLLACAAEEPEPVDVGDPAEELALPDLEDIDWPAAFAEALVTAAGLRGELAWRGHAAALELGREGCPDIYVGAPAVELDLGEAPGGVSWSDYCLTEGGLGFSGAVWWDGRAELSGDAQTPEGSIASGERRMVADGTVSDPDGVRFALDGEVSESVYRADAQGYSRWTWSSLLQGSLAGAEVFEDGATELRADLYLYATGGDVQSFEARGDVYISRQPILGRFDSISMDLAMVAPGSAGPEDCALEPLGYLSLRDAEAYWYDLVFLPRYDDDATDTGYANEPYGTCDGCGTLYVRGLEQGEVCVDFSAIWDGPLDPPAIDDFVTSLRLVEEVR